MMLRLFFNIALGRTIEHVMTIGGSISPKHTTHRVCDVTSALTIMAASTKGDGVTEVRGGKKMKKTKNEG